MGLTEDLLDVTLAALDAPRSREEAWQHFDAKARREESAFQRAATELFNRERVRVADQIESSVAGLKAKDPLPTLADPYIDFALLRIAADYAPGGAYHRAWLERYRGLIGQTMRVGGREVASQVGLSFTLDNPRARDAVLRRVNKLTGNVTETTLQRIRDVVRESMAEGKGVTEITRRIREDAFSGDVTTSRARTIARTESVGSLNEGQYLAATERGVMQSKRWLSQNDGRVRESHANADNDNWIGLAGVFSNGLRYPHDPSAPAEEVINCRCTLQYSDQTPAEANRGSP
jgi:hypothetical protein